MKILILLNLFLFLSLTGCGTQQNSLYSNGVGNNKLHDKQINIEHRDRKVTKTASENYTRLGAGYIDNKNYEKALLKLRKAIRLDGTNANAFKYLGILYWKLGEHQLANNNFNYAHKLSPLNASITHNFAAFLCDNMQYKEGQAMYEKVFNNPLYDRLSNAYQMSADCDVRIGKLERAEEKYKKSIKLLPQNYLAMLGMAKVFYKQENFKLSAYYYNRFVEKMRQTPDSLWLGINIQRHFGDKDKLSSYILELKNLYPDADETLYYIEGKETY